MPSHASFAGVVVRMPIAGQTLHPPGPFKVTAKTDAQPFPLEVTVTE